MKHFSIIALSLLLSSLSAFASERPSSEVCPEAPNNHRDHCAHKGQPFRDLNGKACRNGLVSPSDGDLTEEVKVGTRTECFGKEPDGRDYLTCTAKYVNAYYQSCPHYRGLF